jgi:hypothetical protein
MCLVRLDHASRITQECRMYTKTESPQIIIAAGNKPKKIEEYVGRVATGNAQVSITQYSAFGPDIINRQD